jgi:hypothetical protein
MCTSKRKRVKEWKRCINVAVDYHLLSRLIDQLNMTIDWPSSTSIFLMFSWEIQTYITFFSRHKWRKKKWEREKDIYIIEGIIIVYSIQYRWSMRIVLSFLSIWS